MSLREDTFQHTGAKGSSPYSYKGRYEDPKVLVLVTQEVD